MQKLSSSDRAALLETLPGWRDTPGRDAITRDLTFPDFNAAWGLMTRVALLAERMNHHPEWSNTYNRVSITLATHDCGGVSEKDAAMARAIEAFLSA